MGARCDFPVFYPTTLTINRRLQLHKCSKSVVCQHNKPAIMEPIISSSHTADARRSSRNAIYPKKFSPAPLVYAAAALLQFWGRTILLES